MSGPTYIEEEVKPLEDEATPTLAKVLESAIRAQIVDLRVSMPAIVDKYDKDKQSVDVMPSLKRKFNSGDVIALPKIFNVPVIFPRAGNAIIAMPLQKGDVVQLLFADRSLDKWLSNGGVVDPDDFRMHHLADAVAIPGGYPFNNPVELANDRDIIIKNATTGSSCEIRISKNGHIQILNKNNELIKLLTELIESIINATVNTGLGPQKLIDLTNPFLTQLAKFKTFQEQ